MSCIRYDEGGKGMAHGGCSVSSIEGKSYISRVHYSYIVVISGRWIMYDTGDWDFKIDSDRMGRAVYAKLITSVEDLKRAIIESYGLVGMSVVVEMTYWLGEHGSGDVGERKAPVQISNDKDFDLFTSARKVDKYISHIQRGNKWENQFSEANGKSFEVQRSCQQQRNASWDSLCLKWFWDA
ncbi:unnamed protein product [Brassica oleracea]